MRFRSLRWLRLTVLGRVICRWLSMRVVVIRLVILIMRRVLIGLRLLAWDRADLCNDVAAVVVSLVLACGVGTVGDGVYVL